MTSMDALVILLSVGLILRFALILANRKDVTAIELPRADGAPRSSPHEAAHLTVWPTHPFDRERMVQVLLEGGHITDADARELLREP